jgi:predicted amidohydrolase YtcJ
VAIHVIGDGAAEMALDAFEKAKSAHPEFSPRHGLVHCQVMGADQLARMRRLGVQAFTQPVFINGDMHIARPRLGEERVRDSYSWRSMLELGIPQSFGTDCPVEGLNPMAGIYCAVTRRDFDGNGPFLPEQAISLWDAVYGYTAAGAYASGEEERKGKIRPGMLADFLLLDRDIFSCPESELLHTTVRATWLGGECVYKASDCTVS